MKNEKIRIISKDILILIGIEICFIFVMLGHKNIQPNAFINDLYVFSGLFLIIAIYIFEKAYNKAWGTLAIHGIEIMIFSIMLLSLPYIYFNSEGKFMNFDKYFALSFAIYFFIKIVIISMKKLKNK